MGSGFAGLQLYSTSELILISIFYFTSTKVAADQAKFGNLSENRCPSLSAEVQICGLNSPVLKNLMYR